MGLDQLHIGTLNVEGFTDEQLITLQRIIMDMHIHILCMQETRRSLSDYFMTDSNVIVGLSGGNVTPEWAGIGFIISPRIWQSVIGFAQSSSKYATLKMECPR